MIAVLNGMVAHPSPEDLSQHLETREQTDVGVEHRRYVHKAGKDIKLLLGKHKESTSCKRDQTLSGVRCVLIRAC